MPKNIDDPIPTSWLDPLLSGPEKIIHQSPCPEIELLCNALRERVAVARGADRRRQLNAIVRALKRERIASPMNDFEAGFNHGIAWVCDTLRARRRRLASVACMTVLPRYEQ